MVHRSPLPSWVLLPHCQNPGLKRHVIETLPVKFLGSIPARHRPENLARCAVPQPPSVRPGASKSGRYRHSQCVGDASISEVFISPHDSCPASSSQFHFPVFRGASVRVPTFVVVVLVFACLRWFFQEVFSFCRTRLFFARPSSRPRLPPDSTWFQCLFFHQNRLRQRFYIFPNSPGDPSVSIPHEKVVVRAEHMVTVFPSDLHPILDTPL